MRILGEAAEQRLHQLEAARGWKRSGLASAEQLGSIEKEFDPPAQAGWAVRLLLFGFAYSARAALNTFLAWNIFGDKALWSGTNKHGLGTCFLLSAAPLYLLGEWIVRRHRLYRFGVEEGIFIGVFVQLGYGLWLLMEDPLTWKSRDFLLPGSVASFYLAWLYARMGYVYAAFGAVAAATATLVSQCVGWSDHEIRALAAGLFAGLLAAALLRREVCDHDRPGWQALQAMLVLMISLVLNLRLEHLANLARVEPRGSGVFYWWSFAVVMFLPALAIGWGVRRRQRAMLSAGVIGALIAIVSAKPYLGLARHSWDPAVLGALLMGLSLYLKRWLDAGPQGQRDGWTAKPLIVARQGGPELGGLIAAATAAGATGAPVPQEKGFTGQGGSSGGAGAGGGF